MALKIISWNVNGIRACAKKPGFKEFLDAEAPDMLCLQETKATREQCDEIIGSLETFEHHSWHSAERPGYSGVFSAFLKKPVSVELGAGETSFDREGRILISDHKDFSLLNMYFPNGGSGEERHLFKMRYLKFILNFFKKLDQKKPLILTGDFNIAHKAIDIHDPVRLDGTSGFMPIEREWMDSLVEAGFVDTFRELYPEAREKYSWWSYRQGSRRRNKGWRIDYFFVSKRLMPKVKDARICDQIQGSDHCPLVLELKV